MFAKGAGFWLSGTGSGFNPGAKHLFCALTSPCAGGFQLLVNVSSIKENVYHDPTCELVIGDHKDITKASFIAYEFARTMNQAMIDSHRLGNMLKMTTDFPDELRLRIGQGLLDSEHAVPKMQKYWRDNQHL